MHTGRPLALADFYLADPFVWRAEGQFFATGTGGSEAAGAPGRMVFPILASEDLREWRVLGDALERLHPGLGDTYWAPEVTESDGTYYLYYSVGFADRMHHLRVAASAAPEGPYHDCGVSLTDPFRVPFAIDPHPFRDKDGSWYLFYATDFIDGGSGWKTGTGLVVDRMSTMTALSGAPALVWRPKERWQLFESPRIIYGRSVDWYTLEGPTVKYFDGSYLCLFSGGRWETENYGVDFCRAESVLGPWRCDGGGSAPRILRSKGETLVGPGHCSIVSGSGGDYIAYHAWDRSRERRTMRINRIEWNSECPRVGRAIGAAPR